MKKLKCLIIIVASFFLIYGNVASARDTKHKTLIFFYTSKCAYCHEMADILYKISQKHKIRIIANGSDGNKIAHFPDAISDVALTRKFKITSFPTLVAVDMHKHEFELMCNGLEAEALVEAKILAWIGHG